MIFRAPLFGSGNLPIYASYAGLLATSANVTPAPSSIGVLANDLAICTALSAPTSGSAGAWQTTTAGSDVLYYRVMTSGDIGAGITVSTGSGSGGRVLFYRGPNRIASVRSGGYNSPSVSANITGYTQNAKNIGQFAFVAFQAGGGNPTLTVPGEAKSFSLRTTQPLPSDPSNSNDAYMDLLVAYAGGNLTVGSSAAPTNAYIFEMIKD